MKTLRTAIDYIRQLQELINASDCKDQAQQGPPGIYGSPPSDSYVEEQPWMQYHSSVSINTFSNLMSLVPLNIWQIEIQSYQLIGWLYSVNSFGSFKKGIIVWRFKTIEMEVLYFHLAHEQQHWLKERLFQPVTSRKWHNWLILYLFQPIYFKSTHMDLIYR